MKLIVTDSYEESSRLLADMFLEVIRNKKDSLLGLATGSTPKGLYRYLVDDYTRGKIDFSDVCTINLDEYMGLPRENKQSFGYFMDRHLFSKVNIKQENIMLIDGMGSAAAECQRYEAFLDSHVIDILVLGIGTNGHIGFNEPSDAFCLSTHRVELDSDTLRANARFFDRESDVPRNAVTMGVGGIVRSKKVVLIASGDSKAAAIKAMFADDKVDPLLPCSILKVCGDVSVIIDREISELMK